MTWAVHGRVIDMKTTIFEVDGVTVGDSMTQFGAYGSMGPNGGTCDLWAGGYRVPAKVSVDFEIDPDHRADTQVSADACEALTAALRAKYGPRCS